MINWRNVWISETVFMFADVRHGENYQDQVTQKETEQLVTI